MAACGAFHSIVVTSDGAVLTWGSAEAAGPSVGECRLGRKCSGAVDSAPGHLAVRAAFGGARAVVAACGRDHTAVTTEDGSLYTFGHGGEG
jgi:alpha-tubulin suppressor-like RCC1 family protein